MSLRERLPVIIVAALCIALVIGLAELLPHVLRPQPAFTFEAGDTSPEAPALYASVSGDVASPGLYEIDEDTTVCDLLACAGCSGTPASLELRVGDEISAPQKVDLNTADAWLLEALPGIGPARAEAIVQYRNEHGPFTCIEELSNVDGIGASTIEELSPFVTVSGQ